MSTHDAAATATVSEPGEQPAGEPEPAAAPTGPAAAALLAGAIGVLTLSLAVFLGDASPTVRALLTWSEAVGPLSGRSSVAVIGYLVAWLLLHVRLRDRSVDFARVMTWSLTTVGVALLLIFPPFHMLFYQTLP